MRRKIAPAARADQSAEGMSFMWFGLGALYLVLAVTLGILCIRNGHWVLFIIGIFLPFMWLIGAVMRPTNRLR